MKSLAAPLVALLVASLAFAASDSPYLAGAQKALEKRQARIDAADKQCREDLERLLEKAEKAGDAEAVEAISGWVGELPEAAQSGGDTSASAKNIAGAWVVRYTNGAVRTYVISDDGTVRFVSDSTRHGPESEPATLRPGRHGVTLQFDRGKIERLTPVRGLLLIEHFNPSSDYPNGEPDVVGVAHRNR